MRKNAGRAGMFSVIFFVFCAGAVYLAESRDFVFAETTRFLFTFPVLLCAYFWGKEGGILSSLFAVTLYVPLFLSLLDSEGFSPRAVELLVTLFVLVFIGVLSGALFSRDREAEEVLSFFAGMREKEGEKAEEAFSRMIKKLEACSFFAGKGPSIPVQTDRGEIRLPFRRARLQEKDREFARLFSERLNALLHKIQLVDDAVETKQNFQEILNALPVGVLLMSYKREMLFTNAILRGHFSFYLNNDEEFSALYKDALAEMVDESLSSGGTVYREFALKKAREDQSVFSDAQYGVSCRVVERHNAALFVMEDISHRHAMLSLQEIEALREDFFSGISHDVKNPVSALTGYLSELASRGNENSEQSSVSNAAILKGVQDCLGRIKRLSGDLLDVARLEAGKSFALNLEQARPGKIAREVVETFMPFSPMHAFEVIEENDSEAVCHADPARMKQIFYNLVENAVKYSPRGGKISVAIAEREGCVEARVHDEGIGISAEEIKNIFKKFYRVRNDDTRRIQGTGFGLYLVKTLVEMQGGSIHVQSMAGQGTEFSMKFSMYFVIKLPENRYRNSKV